MYQIDYYAIGQRIRRYRKAKKYSQEMLAELVGISVPHMSHIETANTKLSLPVLIHIAEVLNIQTDDLLFDQPRDSTDSYVEEIARVLDECTMKEARAITSIVLAIKQSFDAYLTQE